MISKLLYLVIRINIKNYNTDIISMRFIAKQNYMNIYS